MVPQGAKSPVPHKTPFRIWNGVLFLWAISITSFPTHVLGKHIDVVGDVIDFNTETKTAHVKDDVQIKFMGHRIDTQDAIFDVPSENLSIQKPFVYTYQDARISGNALVYNFGKQKGTISDISAKVQNSHLTAATLNVTNTRIELQNLTFTTCPNPTPDYIVRTESAYFYPQVGFVVAFNNWLHTPLLPFPLWIPTYIYGSRSYSVIGSSSAIPEVGANNREGLYIKHKIGYFLNEHSAGTVDLGWYIQRGGILYGFTHLEEVSQTSEIHLAAHMVGQDGFQGLAAYYTDLITVPASTSATENEETTPFAKDFLKILQNIKEDTAQVASRLHTGVSYRQLINDSRVSQLPFAKLRLNETYLFGGWHLSGEMGWASIKEENVAYNIVSAQNTHTEFTLGKTVPLTPSTNAGLSMFSNMNWYSTNDTWQRLFASFFVDIQTLGLIPRVSYTKKLLGPFGKSPFDYEQKYAIVSDEIGLTMSVPFLNLEWGYEAFYNIDEKRLRSQNITTGIPFDCWKLLLKTNTIEGTFSFGVMLL